MPRNADGKWTPPGGWPEWRAKFVALAPYGAAVDAVRVAVACETLGCPPTDLYVLWKYGPPVWASKEFVPQAWHLGMTPGDWASFRIAAELRAGLNEAKPKPAAANAGA